jgi:hypothetical protein
MAAGLQDNGAAKGVGVPAQPPLFLNHRPPGRRRHPVDDETQWLAARVRIDRPDYVTHEGSTLA